EVLAGHPAVAECAVIGVNDPLKGQIPRGFVVLKAGNNTDPEVLSAELVGLIREHIGAVAALRRVDIVTGLPKTRSGKILRKTMRGIADGHNEPVPSTFADPAPPDPLAPLCQEGEPRTAAMASPVELLARTVGNQLAAPEIWPPRQVTRRLLGIDSAVEATVQGYVSDLLDKLGSSSRLEALVRVSEAA